MQESSVRQSAFLSRLVYVSSLKIEATFSSETSGDFHRATRRYIRDDNFSEVSAYICNIDTISDIQGDIKGHRYEQSVHKLGKISIRFLVGKPLEKKALEKMKKAWEYSIKTHLRKIF
jgi:hypothetical protein